MSKAIVIHETGGPEVLKLQQVNIKQPGSGEVLIAHSAIGINFIDIYHRSGVYPLPTMPSMLGIEACGYIEDIGPDVEGFQIGDRVAYATSLIPGAYSEKRVINAKYIVAVPDYINDEQVAALLAKGLTAHYLLRRTFFVKFGDTVLIHAAAGGVGKILCQWAKYCKATVIGTVGSDEKIKIAKDAGCDYVINYQTENFKNQVLEITNGKGVNVVYDSVGKDTFFDSIDCLVEFGVMASYGESSGKVPPFDISILNKKSSFLTKPSLFQYKSIRMELVLSANEVFELFRQKIIKVDNYNKYDLNEIAQAHNDIELRKTVGSSILLI
jgi:NADPH2:quinone reductase